MRRAACYQRHSTPTGLSIMSGQPQADSQARTQAMQRILRDAVAHHQAGRREQAEAGYRALLREDPDHADALHLLGVLANDDGAFQKGAALIRRALVMMPQFPDGYLNLGNALNGSGDVAGARAAFERAIALRPDFLLARLNLAEFLVRHGDHTAAELHARHGLHLAPGLERALLALWQALRGQRRWHDATAVMQATIGSRPGVPALLCDLGSTLAEAGDTETALALHRQAAIMEPGNFLIHMGHANSLNAAGKIADAVPVLRRVLELAPDYIPAWLTLGWSLRGIGRFEEARGCFNRALEIDPHQPEAHWNLSLLGPAPEIDPVREAALRGLMQREEMDLFQRVSAGFALGKMLDDQDRCDDAFAVLADANRMYHDGRAAQGMGFDPAGFSAEVDLLIGHFSAPGFAGRRGSGVASDLPVFIVGMPRSGTTLVEQIAASHSRVHGGGESRDIANIVHALTPMIRAAGPEGAWDQTMTATMARAHLERLARLGGNATRVIDKTPDNVLNLGVIAALFPGARVIMCSRDPRDTCLSHFFQLYTDGNAFAYDLAECGWRARETARLLEHWRAVLPIKFLDLQYETLVENLEGQARRIIDFLGLDWEPACLDFHRNERAVATPNMWGVRQPIYNRQVGRWRLYEKHLAPLFAALDGTRPGG